VNGVGRETADSILLYSFDIPIFVIDAYTRRIVSRHFGIPHETPYDEVQEIFMKSLPLDTQLFNEYHALIVRVGKEFCKKKGCAAGCTLEKSLKG
jgi:endonuclease-3 related protein